MVSLEVFPGASFLVEGEIPRGIYLLTGPSGVGKTVFCKLFVAGGLSNLETGIYLSTDEDCEEIQASIRNLMEDENRVKGDLRLIDAYSWRFSGVANDARAQAINVTVPVFLFSIVRLTIALSW